MDFDRMLKPALIAGVVLGLLSLVPGINWLNCLCGLLIIGGGLLAAYLYIKDSAVPVTSGQGAMVGLLAGVIGTVVKTIIQIPLALLFGMGLSAAFLRRLDVPPEARRIMEFVAANVWIFFMLAFFTGLVLSCVFGAIGGALGVTFFEKRRGELGPYPPAGPPYTPPGSSYPPPNPPPPSGYTPPSTPPPSSKPPDPGPPPS